MGLHEDIRDEYRDHNAIMRSILSGPRERLDAIDRQREADRAAYVSQRESDRADEVAQRNADRQEHRAAMLRDAIWCGVAAIIVGAIAGLVLSRFIH